MGRPRFSRYETRGQPLDCAYAAAGAGLTHQRHGPNHPKRAALLAAATIPLPVENKTGVTLQAHTVSEDANPTELHRLLPT